MLVTVGSISSCQLCAMLGAAVTLRLLTSTTASAETRHVCSSTVKHILLQKASPQLAPWWHFTESVLGMMKRMLMMGSAQRALAGALQGWARPVKQVQTSQRWLQGHVPNAGSNSLQPSQHGNCVGSKPRPDMTVNSSTQHNP